MLYLLSLFSLLLLPFTHARDPLHDTTTIFLSALTSRDHITYLQSRLAPNVTYTENNIPIPLGSGLWKRAGPMNGDTDIIVYRHSHADYPTGQIATITTLLDDGQPVIYTVRLRLDERGRITEIESHIVPDWEGAERYQAYASDMIDVWTEDDESGGVWRLPGERLVELAKEYYSKEDAEGLNASMFQGGCIRLENGRELESCVVEAPARRAKTVVRERWFVIQGTDTQRQSVFSFAMMDVIARNAAASVTWYVAEGLRFNGLEKIDRVETTWVEVPFYSEAPFGTWRRDW